MVRSVAAPCFRRCLPSHPRPATGKLCFDGIPCTQHRLLCPQHAPTVASASMLATLSASRGNDGLQAAAAASNWLSMDAVDPQVARSVGGAAHVLQQQLAFVVAVLRRQLEEAEADLATLQWQQNAYLASPGMFMAALERGNLQVCHTTATMHPVCVYACACDRVCCCCARL